jgi:hypothetical protein
MPAEPDPSITIEGERKTVTALFADINGSTELMEDLDPEEARAIIDAQADDRCGPSLRWLRRAIRWRWDLRAFWRAPVALSNFHSRSLLVSVVDGRSYHRVSASPFYRAGSGPSHQNSTEVEKSASFASPPGIPYGTWRSSA